MLGLEIKCKAVQTCQDWCKSESRNKFLVLNKEPQNTTKANKLPRTTVTKTPQSSLPLRCLHF